MKVTKIFNSGSNFTRIHNREHWEIGWTRKANSKRQLCRFVASTRARIHVAGDEVIEVTRQAEIPAVYISYLPATALVHNCATLSCRCNSTRGDIERLIGVGAEFSSWLTRVLHRADEYLNLTWLRGPFCPTCLPPVESETLSKGWPTTLARYNAR